MSDKKNTGPLKHYNVTFTYTMTNQVVATVSAFSEDEARLKIFQNIGKEAENLIVTGVYEIPELNDSALDGSILADHVTQAIKPN